MRMETIETYANRQDSSFLPLSHKREPLLTPDLPLFSDQAGDFMLFKD